MAPHNIVVGRGSRSGGELRDLRFDIGHPIASGTYCAAELRSNIGVMRRGVIDGDDWIARRLAFLRNLLEQHELPESQRKAAEAEVAVLQKERGLTSGGFRMARVLRRWHVR